MSIVVYHKSTNSEYQQGILKNLYQTLKDKGKNITYWEGDSHFQADVAVIFGSWKKVKVPEGEEIPDSVKHHVLKNNIIRQQGNKPTVVIETPLLGRKITDKHQQHRFGLNHFMYKLADFKNNNSKSDRFDKLGLKIKKWRKPTDDGHILIACQNLNDASLFGINFSLWLTNTVKHLLMRTKRKIIIRDHPENKTSLKNLLHNFFLAHTDQVEYQASGTIIDSLKNAHCMVSYTSGSSIDSILEGVPVIPGSEYNFVYDISSHSLDDIENPKLGDRKQLLYNLAYAQWSVEEIQNGTAWEHLFNENNRNNHLEQ
jgi:hypothetical protein